jgi:hypothetical protein
MEQQNGVVSDIGTEKIIFSQSQPDVSADPFSGMDQAQMIEKAQAMMAQMDPAELKKMQEMFLNMSDDEKQDMMKKGKDLGII